MDLRRIASIISSDAQFGILSAFTDDPDTNNTEMHQELLKELENRGYTPKEFSGQWEGSKELSILVPHIPEKDLVEFGKKYGQKAVVYRDSNGARLIDLLSQDSTTS